MTLLWLLLYAPAAMLVLRALTSNDVRWPRALGAGVAAGSAGLPMLANRAGLPFALSIALLAAAPIYLVAWSAFSTDPDAPRIASVAVALIGGFAIFLLYQFAANYRE
jgi:hypothetical protein